MMCPRGYWLGLDCTCDELCEAGNVLTVLEGGGETPDITRPVVLELLDPPERGWYDPRAEPDNRGDR